MIQTIRVRTNKGLDIRGENLLGDIHNLLHLGSVKKVKTAKVYRLEGIKVKEAQRLAKNLFFETINQTYSINQPILNGTGHIIEIAYKPGVMNPEAASIIKAAKDLGINLLAADSSWEYGFYGQINRRKLEEVVERLNLYNKTVEHIVRKAPQTLLLKGQVGQTAVIPIRNMSDETLLELSKDKLFLNLEEMRVIQNYFRQIGRDPTDCELETLAQTWSEHCGHKTFKAKIFVDGKEKEPLISRIKKEALKYQRHIISAFIDNSGVMDFYEDWAICGKGETHNSPSAVEPYGGAMTGSGGVFRDIIGTGQGGKTILSTDVFCFAPPGIKTSKLPPGTLPSRYLLKQVVAGVRDYGNRMGIPTGNGSIHFHDDFRAKPTVFVGAYGLIPKAKAKKGIPQKGDLVICVGGRVGRDGIHGATFSSGEMTDRTITVNAQAVQIGNAIEEKRTFDAILEARDKNCLRAIQDCGGGGLSSAVGEMGKDLGVTVQLWNVALKYQGLAPWEIWLSESQERMILAIPPNRLDKFKKICQKYNVEVTNLGRFDGSRKLKVYFGKKIVCDLKMEFLHDGLPQRKMIATNNKQLPKNNKKAPQIPKTQKQWFKIFKKVLSSGNVCSKEPIVRLYDHSVGGTNSLQPFSGEKLDGPNDAIVLRPLLDKPYGMVVSHGLNPILNRLDPYWGSIWAATEAISNYAAVGGDYKNASLINNYIWPFPDEESLWSLDRSVDAVVDFMRILKVPVVSGKDSLSSTYRGKDGLVIKIPPVLCISVFGKIPDVAKTVSSDFKKTDSVICLIGKIDYQGMGGSAYFDVMGIVGEKVPHPDLSFLPRVLETLYRAINKGQILSCHDVSEGGLITTIFEMCVGGNMGAVINMAKIGKERSDYLLFNETAGCFIVEIENTRVARELFKNVPFAVLGKTQRAKVMTVSVRKKPLFRANIEVLKKAWQGPMKRIFT